MYLLPQPDKIGTQEGQFRLHYNTRIIGAAMPTDMVLDIYEHAKLLLDLVPSLASFGHMYEVLSTRTYAHLCELENSDKEEYSLIGRMEHHTLNVSSEESFAMPSA